MPHPDSEKIEYLYSEIVRNDLNAIVPPQKIEYPCPEIVRKKLNTIPMPSIINFSACTIVATELSPFILFAPFTPWISNFKRLFPRRSNVCEFDTQSRN
jgi:hypothetical protein